MPFLVGTTLKEYVIKGILIPKKAYNERERELGRRPVVEITHAEYGMLGADKIFQALVKSGDVSVHDKRPEGNETPEELRASVTDSKRELEVLREENAQLKQQVTDLEAKLTAAVAAHKALEQESIEVIRKQEATIAELKKKATPPATAPTAGEK